MRRHRDVVEGVELGPKISSLARLGCHGLILVEWKQEAAPDEETCNGSRNPAGDGDSAGSCLQLTEDTHGGDYSTPSKDQH